LQIVDLPAPDGEDMIIRKGGQIVFIYG